MCVCASKEFYLKWILLINFFLHLNANNIRKKTILRMQQKSSLVITKFKKILFIFNIRHTSTFAYLCLEFLVFLKFCLFA